VVEGEGPLCGPGVAEFLAAEQHDEWIKGRRYLGLKILAKVRITAVPDPATAPEEVPTSDIPALSA
jgi:hypothetical protein